MKRFLKTTIAVGLTAVMFSISPLTDLSPSARAASNDGKYISEVMLGMGSSAGYAASSLENKGYKVMKVDGEAFDLNAKASTENNSTADRPSSQSVVLGYKTTDNRNEAITDLAVMNMEGGYSVQKYQEMLKENMQTKIVPFLNRFITTLREYRENLKKPKETDNYKRADLMRQSLNKITDDDTDGTPLGDLLINETKFELGDSTYNSLADSEKKKHADIVTMFQQGDDMMIYLMCNLLARATDTSEDSWLDRLAGTTLEDLEAEMNASTRADVNAKLDKEYQDYAKGILSHWDDLSSDLNEVEEAQEIVNEYDSDEAQKVAEQADELGEDASPEEKQELTEAADEQFQELQEVTEASVIVRISEYLDKIPYQFTIGENSGSTMLDFFRLSPSDFSGENIRALYPLVDALSAGQIMGLDYLPVKDMIHMGTGIEKDDFSVLDDIETISFYNAVNREIYDPDGVALTNEAMRKEAAAKDINQDKENISASSLLLILGAVSVVVGVGIALGIRYLTKISPNVAGAVVFVTILVSAALFISAAAMYKSEQEIEYKKIPKYMVDEIDIMSYNSAGERVLVKNQRAYYKVAMCNRKDITSSYESRKYDEVGDHGDLNGDIGKQWLALYSVKSENGSPIMAKSLTACMGTTSAPEGYSTGIHEFGSTVAANLNKKAYVRASNPPSIFVYFMTEVSALDVASKDPGAVGSLFAGAAGDLYDSMAAIKSQNAVTASGADGESGGITATGIALGGGIGIILGGLLGALLMYFSRRKKKEAL